MKKRVLEIGCGQGFNCFVFSKNKNNKVIGIDLSKNDIKISKERYPNIEFSVMNAQDLKFKNNTFDTVYALDVLEHVDNLNKTLDEVHRCIKRKGKFIINVPHYNSEKWLLKVRPTYFKEIHHVRIFKENELEDLLEKRQFKLVKKQRKGFLQHIELYILFKRKINSKTQVSIGSWRDNYFTKLIHAMILFTDPIVLKTPLVYFPVWIFTIPFGIVVNSIGSKFFPKSQYYEFKNT